MKTAYPAFQFVSLFVLVQLANLHKESFFRVEYTSQTLETTYNISIRRSFIFSYRVFS